MHDLSDIFQSLLQQHRLILYKVAHSYAHTQADQEDLVQEIILQMWRSFPRYDDQFKFSTWTYRIALNVAISYARKLHTHRKHFSPLSSPLAQSIPAETEEELPGSAALHQFIADLDPLNRALMLLHLDGYKHADIADTLGISVSNVATKLNRLKNKLRQSLRSTS